MPIRQSACIPAMKPKDMPLELFAEAIARIGYHAAEIWRVDDQFDETFEILARHGLRLVSFVGGANMGSSMNDPRNHDREQEALTAAIDRAAAHDVPGVIAFSGNVRPGVSREESIAATIEGFKRIAPYAEAKGVNVNIELLNSKRDHRGYECDHTPWAVEVVNGVNSPRVKILYDIYHMQIMEGDVIQTLRDHHTLIGHIHTAGVPGRHEIDASQELNYTAIAQALSQIGYVGYVGHEFFPTRDALKGARDAFTICDVP